MPKELERPIERSLEQYLINPDNSAFYPTLGKLIKKHLLELNFDTLDPTDQWEVLQQIENQLESNAFYLIEVNNTPTLSLINTNDGIELSYNPIDALNQFYHSYHRDFLFGREKNQAISVISKRINQAKAYIQKTERELNLLEKAIPPNHLADIIMANLFSN